MNQSYKSGKRNNSSNKSTLLFKNYFFVLFYFLQRLGSKERILFPNTRWEINKIKPIVLEKFLQKVINFLQNFSPQQNVMNSRLRHGNRSTCSYRSSNCGKTIERPSNIHNKTIKACDHSKSVTCVIVLWPDVEMVHPLGLPFLLG